MLINMTRGANMELDTVSGSLSLTSTDLIIVQIPVEPLLVLLRTTAGGATELAAHYRQKSADDFTVKASSPAGVVTARVYGETWRSISFHVTNVSTANPATLEYYIMGVKR